MQENEGGRFYRFERYLQLQGCGKPRRFKCMFHYCVQSSSVQFMRTFHGLELAHPQIHHLIEHTQLFYIDPFQQTNYFLGNYPLQEEACVFFTNWEASAITISCRGINELIAESHPLKLSKTVRQSKQRTIEEATIIVGKWRLQFQKAALKGKPVSLIGAARAIGISKKTLDDYARYIKQGQQLGFDLENNSGQKISTLRNFVREHRYQRVQLQDPDIYWEVECSRKENSE